MSVFQTHEVFNQATPLQDVNLFASDLALQEALTREGAGWAAKNLYALGWDLGQREMQELARQANAYGPRHLAFDRSGQRIDEIEFHPAWHAIMQRMIGEGAHAAPWEGGQGGAHVARAALYLLLGQWENGAQCPVTMSFASVPALRQAPPAIVRDWLPKLLSRQYDPRSKPISEKTGALIGMGMTEKQGGTDVRTNSTFARPLDPAVAGARYGEDYAQAWELVGHKWFFSAPQCDAHLVLAQTEAGSAAGLSCFFVPRYLPDGSRNAIVVQRLKEKVGNKSNASSEVEFQGAHGWLVGDIGRGVPTILEMGSLTRLDCVLGTAGILRAALSHALQHARGRVVFGKPLAEQPLMQNVLADLALESEAATVFAMRLARCYDEAAIPGQRALARLLTPAGKYWLCKRGPAFGAEAMEVMGGNGYVEDGPLGRLYRELPVNSIWEGSGNVMCLDVLRALNKSHDARNALLAELELALGRDSQYDRAVAAMNLSLASPHQDEGQARVLAERIVLIVQAGLLLRHAPPYVSQAFVATRLPHGPGGAFGLLPPATDFAAILARALTP